MKIAHIHFYVENATDTKNWFIRKMGFQSLGENSNSHTQTELIGNKNLLFLISSALSPASSVSDYLKDHPPGVVDIAFRVTDLELMLSKIFDLGIKVFHKKVSTGGNLQSFKIKGWGDYYHTLVADSNDSLVPEVLPNPLGILSIDHVVLNVPQGQLNAAVNWYRDLFGFQVQQTFTIQTNNSGLYSKALIDDTGQIQFNVNEPSTTNSQIQTFLDHNRGAGIQHIALRTQNIFDSVTHLREKKLEFLPIPISYYLALKKPAQGGITSQEWQKLEILKILLDYSDREPEALLLQIFTQPIFDQPTFFFELIERRQQRQGFGEGNFLALFQAMENSLA